MKQIIYTLMLIIAIIFSGCSLEQKEILDTHDSQLVEQVPVETNNEFLNVVGKQNNLTIISSEVVYYGDVKGYLAKPDDNKAYPGIVIIHEWWGLNENIKNTADVLASEGYVVLAVDLYNGEIAKNSTEAMALRNKVNKEESIENMKSAVNYLRETQGSEKVASYGWCFGGGKSAELSVSDVKLDATIIYYGTLPQNISEIEKIKGPVLGVFGRNDTAIAVKTVDVFKMGLEESDIKNEIYVYDGVGHAFANPSGANFAKEETKDSWNKTLVFLEDNLK